jgi:hypothetical protein
LAGLVTNRFFPLRSEGIDSRWAGNPAVEWQGTWQSMCSAADSWQVMWLDCASLEALGANIPFRSDSLVSLVNQPLVATAQKVGGPLR